MVVLGETATAIEYLRTALELDPTNDRAADRLLEIVEPNDPAAAVEILERRARPSSRKSEGTRKQRSTTARRARHHRRAAVLWNDHLGRVDRALWHWQQAWKLEPQRTEALEAGAAAVRVARRRRDGRASCGRPSSTCSATTGRPAVARRRSGSSSASSRCAEGPRGRGESPRGGAEARSDARSRSPRRSPRSTRARVPRGPDARTRPASCSSSSASGGSRRATTRPASTTCGARSASIRTRRAARQALEEALSETSQWDELDRILRHRSAVVTGSGRARRRCCAGAPRCIATSCRIATA